MTEHEDMLLSLLRLPSAPKGWETIANDGRFYTPVPLRDEWMLSAPTYCFDNALETHDEYGLTYVEGFALSASTLGIPIHHAWNIEANGDVVDVTWPTVGLAYRGIEIPDIEIVRAARAAEMSALTWSLVSGSPV